MIRELLAYISFHLEEKIDLDRLAAVSGYSPYYLHRLLKAELKESIGSYIKKQRMKKAAYLIGLTNAPIREIGGLVGYENDSAFARAFRSLYGVSPLAFRDNNELKAQMIALDERYVSLSCRAVRLKEQPALIFPSHGNYFSKDIYRVWKEVAGYLDEHQLKEEDFDYYAVLHHCQNIDAGGILRYDAAMVPRNGLPLKARPHLSPSLPAGHFAVYRFCSKVADYQPLSLAITRHLIETSGFEHREDIAYFRFHGLPDWEHPDDLLIDWYLPIR